MRVRPELPADVRSTGRRLIQRRRADADAFSSNGRDMNDSRRALKGLHQIRLRGKALNSGARAFCARLALLPFRSSVTLRNSVLERFSSVAIFCKEGLP